MTPASPLPTFRDVAARGARIRFAEAGSGPPLVLVHDYLSSHVAWGDVLPELARHFYVITPDLPGFGESEKPPPSRYSYGADAFAESLVDLVAALGVGRVSICGHGLGGAIALTLAANHPHLVDRLVLVSPVVYPADPDRVSRLAAMPFVGPVFFKQLFGRSMFRSYLRERAYGGTAPVPWDRIDTLFDAFNVPAAREAAYATMLSLLDTRALMASVPRVLAPALVACGRRAPACPVEHGRRLARELRAARFEVFECGHSPAEQSAGAFAQIAVAFLTDKKG
jgi:pimeloyl-ACP methyl ester carboxylesterase